MGSTDLNFELLAVKAKTKGFCNGLYCCYGNWQCLEITETCSTMSKHLFGTLLL